MTKRIGIFDGSSALPIELEPVDLNVSAETPWGQASGQPRLYRTPGAEIVAMQRHGPEHEFAPHEINYRANVWLMCELGVECVVGTYTVGGIDPTLAVGSLVVPEQVIDYTWGRAQTYDDKVRHIDFTNPYDSALIASLCELGAYVQRGGVYAATQGPRLESAAEIRRLAADGCTVVGMTGMPEAALARELELPFAAVCLVVNPAAGVVPGEVDMGALLAASRSGGQAMAELVVQFAVRGA